MKKRNKSIIVQPVKAAQLFDEASDEEKLNTLVRAAVNGFRSIVVKDYLQNHYS